MEKDVKLVFTSTSGRSGTGFLTNLINENSLNATAEHDPYPRGYGDPIRWYDNDEHDKLKIFVKKKLKRLERGIKYENLLRKPIINKMVDREKTDSYFYKKIHLITRSRIPSVQIKDIYIESTHAFNKSFGEELMKQYGNVDLIHLKRDPLEVSKSFLNRNSIPDPNNPFLLYPGLKKNILKMDSNLTSFQKCLWYWFETELRHQNLLSKFDFKSITDFDLNDFEDIKRIESLFKKLDIEYKNIDINLKRNENKKKTELTKKDMEEAKEMMNILPDWVFDRVNDTYGLPERLERF